MSEKLVLTPEQLFFLGTLMGAEHIDYDYIAAMHELGRNYQRTQQKCISELSQAGMIRQRLSGEISLRPLPEMLLKNLFFGKTETVLEVYRLGDCPERQTHRFHWMNGTATWVQMDNQLHIAGIDEAGIEALLTQFTQTAEQPTPASSICKARLTGILMVKHATVDTGSNGLVLFEQDGGLYTVDSNGIPTGIPARQARQLLLTVLKGE